MKYTVKYGDTLRMIAQRELGNIDRWTEIVELNNLKYPYISDTSSKGVVSFGDVIRLPIEEGIQLSQRVSLGTDLALSTNKSNLSFNTGGDLIVGADGDYSLVSELDCLRQDISHRKMTPLGTLAYHPEYGSDITTIVGKKKDENWRIKAQIEIERTLRSDSRISDVHDVAIEDIPTGMKVNYTAVASGLVFTGGVED